MRWPWKKRAAATAAKPVPDPASLIETLQPAEPTTNAMRPGSIARLLPIGRIIEHLFGVLRDPNGKISSKRAGAGALVTAGIYFLDRGDIPAGIVCLVAAILLFFLTKYDPQ